MVRKVGDTGQSFPSDGEIKAPKAGKTSKGQNVEKGPKDNTTKRAETADRTYNVLGDTTKGTKTMGQYTSQFLKSAEKAPDFTNTTLNLTAIIQGRSTSAAA
ncbi:MAG: hypothetical protein AB7N99_02145 [Simkaniaceae bacterium]